MRYETTYKDRQIIIKPTLAGDYIVIRSLGLSVKKMRHFPNATQALAWIKKAIDSNQFEGKDRVFWW
ncbi:hypothetical protein I8748_20110 [Nostoc sp. CENA67]|uniref:Uncharacterized protein n=1 Tax=Amazonocrinis nigriterrae CENA67 TaxID=2794033 RepID=A0A8J7L9I1_9NOST|nr:hypothetical protein [Amazonocrinis nigriterrae]MBH8564458.1 hypothetical protein [Amazonocrinis nigriterrae CENA67]